jgi:hypothetical protein
VSVRHALWGLLACCMGVAPALAHTRSESYSNWQVSGTTVRVAFTVPDTEARRLAPPGGAMPGAEQLGDYLAAHLGVSAAGGRCARTAGPDPVATLPGVARYEFVFECPDANGLKLWSSAFFEFVPTHTHLAQIQSADGNFSEQLITRDHQTLELSAATGGALQSASFLQYIALGIMHIFTGVDHQAFLLGLILLSRRVRDLVFVVTGFTLGHSATLALAVTGVLRPHAEYIDALIGLTIALVGAECIAENTHRPATVAIAIGALLLAMAAGKLLGLGGLPPLLVAGSALFAANYLVVAGHLRDAVRLRLLVTVVFGFIHGFGFAANLLAMKLPAGRLAELLFGFNLGVEIGQLTLILVVAGVAALLVKNSYGLPRRLVSDFGAAGLVGIGLYWFVSRSYA